MQCLVIKKIVNFPLISTYILFVCILFVKFFKFLRSLLMIQDKTTLK